MTTPETIAILSGALALLAGVSAAVTWIMASRRILIDTPNDRSSHKQPTPRAGGVGIVAATICGVLGLYLAGVLGLSQGFLAFALGALLAAIGGLVDDIRPLPFLKKLVVQVAAAAVAMAGGLVLHSIHVPGVGPVALGIFAWPLTLLWIVGLTNAFNFMDGLDGLAASTALITAVALAAIGHLLDMPLFPEFALILAAACAGFLIFNVAPARIFMGDVGSQFLGFVFACLGLALAQLDFTGTAILIVPLLLLHFLFDTIWTAWRRWRRGEHLATAHRSHLYQRLNQSGWRHGRVAALLAAMASAQALGAIAMIYLPPDWCWALLLAFTALQLAYAAWVTRLGR